MGIKPSQNTIKRVFKSGTMIWHRIRKVLGGKLYEKELVEIAEPLEELKKREQKSEIDLIYLDETGFYLVPYVPYCWNEIGKKITVKSERSKGLNVIGFFNRPRRINQYRPCAYGQKNLRFSTKITAHKLCPYQTIDKCGEV